MMFLAFCLLNDIADQQLIISAVVVHGCNFLSIEKFAVIESFFLILSHQYYESV